MACLAYAASLLIYQFGSLFAGGGFTMGTAAAILVLAFVLFMRIIKKMKKMTKVIASVLGLTMLVGASVSAEGTITFGTNPEFPPFECVVADGVIDIYDGIDMAIAKQIAEDNDMEAVVENYEFDSLLIALQNGQIDAVIAGMTVTEERAESVDFSTPYYTATQVMIVPEDSDITCAADMEGKTICVIQGYTGETCVQELGYEYESFKKGSEAVTE